MTERSRAGVNAGAGSHVSPRPYKGSLTVNRPGCRGRITLSLEGLGQAEEGIIKPVGVN